MNSFPNDKATPTQVLKARTQLLNEYLLGDRADIHHFGTGLVTKHSLALIIWKWACTLEARVGNYQHNEIAAAFKVYSYTLSSSFLERRVDAFCDRYVPRYKHRDLDSNSRLVGVEPRVQDPVRDNEMATQLCLFCHELLAEAGTVLLAELGAARQAREAKEAREIQEAREAHVFDFQEILAELEEVGWGMNLVQGGSST